MADEGRPAGHLLSRREVLTLLGATGAAWFMTGSAKPQTNRCRHTWTFMYRPARTDRRAVFH